MVCCNGENSQNRDEVPTSRCGAWEEERELGGTTALSGYPKVTPSLVQLPKNHWLKEAPHQSIYHIQEEERSREGRGEERVDRQTEEERDRNRETERSYKYCSRVTSNLFPLTMPYPLKYGQLSIMLSNCHAIIGVTQWWIQIVMIHW